MQKAGVPETAATSDTPCFTCAYIQVSVFHYHQLPHGAETSGKSHPGMNFTSFHNSQQMDNSQTTLF